MPIVLEFGHRRPGRRRPRRSRARPCRRRARRPSEAGSMPTMAAISSGFGRAQHLDHQVGADVARPDDRDTRSWPFVTSCEKPVRTEPKPVIRASNVARRDRHHRAERAGEHHVAGAQRVPGAGHRWASQTSACSGLPRQAAPAPTETGSPAVLQHHPASRRSTSASRRGRVPSTKGRRRRCPPWCPRWRCPSRRSGSRRSRWPAARSRRRAAGRRW